MLFALHPGLLHHLATHMEDPPPTVADVGKTPGLWLAHRWMPLHKVEAVLEEASGLLAGVSPTSESVTRLALPGDEDVAPYHTFTEHRRHCRDRLREKVRLALFDLLDRLTKDASNLEAVAATQLVEHLAGAKALDHFEEMAAALHWLRVLAPARSQNRIVGGLIAKCPEAFDDDSANDVADSPKPRLHLSYRLYLMQRLRNWPSWSNVPALAALSREEIGDIINRAVNEDAEELAALVAEGPVS